jgi:cyclopropane-fatty-acyl-phospholipid synthase
MKMNSTPQRRRLSKLALGPWKRAIRAIVLKKLSALRGGSVQLSDASGTQQLGAGGQPIAVHVEDERFFRRVALAGSLGAAESYIAGEWQCDDLMGLMRLFVRNRHATTRLDRGWSWLMQLGARFGHWRRANSRRGSRRNIGAHYDLGNDFFQLWLDPTLAYSSGIFPQWSSSLHEASTEKFDRVCRKLDLRAGDRVLEIGTGWGGFALHAARHYGCHLTTTTISREQYDLACQRVAAAGLSDQITVLNCDYRDLVGQFDKLVSIEMIEAVGPRYLDAFFRKCGELLKPAGSIVLQGIVMPERDYRGYLASVDFIRKHVFPGGSLPSVAALLESAGRASRLRCVQLEDFAPHYAETLRRWRANFEARLPEIRTLGYTERLIRLWRYYLCYCEAGFEERQVSVVQLVFDNVACRRDALLLTRSASSALDRKACGTITQPHFGTA